MKTQNIETLAAFIVASHLNPSLIRAVVAQLGGWEAFTSSAPDIANHGIDGGFSGFIYYTDTVAFFRRHRAPIHALAEEQAAELGENVADMVAGFNCLAGRDMTPGTRRGDFPNDRRAALNEYLPSVSRCLYGGRLTDDDTTVATALAWYAGEEVARAYNDLIDGN